MSGIGYSFEAEKKEQELCRGVIKPGQIVFDVGAHVGNYTRLFSELVGPSGHVYAFEPTHLVFNKLKMNAGLSNITLINQAVYSISGKFKLHEFEQGFDVFNSLRVPTTDHKPVRIVQVDAVSLDWFCKSNKILSVDYLKIDTEGAEREIFRGAEKLLTQKRIGYIQFEISRAFLDGFGINPSQVFEELWNKGYECHIINTNGTIGAKTHDTEAYQDNFIAFQEGYRNG